MLETMGRLPKAKSVAGRTVGRFLRFGMLRGLKSVEVDPAEFRKHLADKHDLWVPNFNRMRDVPLEKLDAIAEHLMKDAQRLAMAQGAGFGLGGAITLLPDASFLTVITLRLIQRLCLLYGFEETGQDKRVELWMAAGAAAGIDLGKDFAEKQLFEKVAPRIASRLALKIGEESAEKWIARIVPLASSAIGGILNYTFVRTWGRRVQKHLRERHLALRTIQTPQDVTLRPVIVRG